MEGFLGSAARFSLFLHVTEVTAQAHPRLVFFMFREAGRASQITLEEQI